MMESMNTYVGIANSVPDSRTPRRFMVVSTTTTTTANSVSWPRRAGMADAAYCDPDETDTATVST